MNDLKPARWGKILVRYDLNSISIAIQREREKQIRQATWLSQLKSNIANLPNLDNRESRWIESQFIHDVGTSLSEVTTVTGIDGGIISSPMTGFDLIIYRAVASTFKGIGKNVTASYYPSFDPEPAIYFAPSFGSRVEFTRAVTLLRLLEEYKVTTEVISKVRPSIILLDGRVTPLLSDFSDGSSPTLLQLEQDVKLQYRDMLSAIRSEKAIIMGVIKDTRSRTICTELQAGIPRWVRSQQLESKVLKGWRENTQQMLDFQLSEGILEVGKRTAFIRQDLPHWALFRDSMNIRSTMMKPIPNDLPIRVEVICDYQNTEIEQQISLGLSSINLMCRHGLPMAVPSVLIEADERAKLNEGYLETVLNQISVELGLTRDELMLRREFRNTTNTM